VVLMARTTQDLSKKVMELLGLLEAQEDVSAEDHALIANAYSDKFEELFFRDIAYWSADEIDNKAFRAMARIMAEEVASAFSKPVPTEFSEAGQPISMGTKGLMDLRRIVAREKSGLPTPGVFF
jgi:hypothetical protein